MTPDWETEVRDPAMHASEGERVVQHGRARVAYSLAPIPGGWAWTADAQSGFNGRGTPWCGPLPTRNDALQAVLVFLRDAMQEYSQQKTGDHGAPDDARRVADAIADGLLGFTEPDPLPEILYDL